MDPHRLARRHAYGRIAVGGALALAPGVAARVWIGRTAATPGGRVMTTAMGARDVAIGLGELRALSSRRPGAVTPWLTAAAIADAADLAATLRARDDLPRLGVAGVTAMATGAIALAAWLHRRLPRATP
jgi:hypothetical protein